LKNPTLDLTEHAPILLISLRRMLVDFYARSHTFKKLTRLCFPLKGTRLPRSPRCKKPSNGQRPAARCGCW
jgi:hypothetical protein